MTIYHCCLDVERGMTDRALSVENRAMCVTAHAMGYAVIPFGRCDNFDYQRGCQGHPSPDSAASPTGGEG